MFTFQPKITKRNAAMRICALYVAAAAFLFSSGLMDITGSATEFTATAAPPTSQVATSRIAALLRDLEQLSEKERVKYRAVIVKLNRDNHELLVQAADLQQQLRETKSRVASLAAAKKMVDRKVATAERTADNATLQAAAALLDKKQASQLQLTTKTTQKAAQETQAEAKKEQESAKKNADAAGKLKAQAATEEAAALKLKVEWAEKEAQAAAAKAAAATAEDNASEARQSAARIEAVALQAFDAAVAKEAEAKRAEQVAADLEESAGKSEANATSLATLLQQLKETAASQEAAAKLEVIAAIAKVKAARQAAAKVGEALIRIESQQKSIAAKTKEILVQSGVRREKPVVPPPAITPVQPTFQPTVQPTVQSRRRLFGRRNW